MWICTRLDAAYLAFLRAWICSLHEIRMFCVLKRSWVVPVCRLLLLSWP